MDEFLNLKEGVIVKGPFWPEPVKLVSFRQIGSNFKLESAGIKTNTFYPQILTKDDLGKIEVFKESKVDFTGNAESFFLSIESWRIRFAYQFDPLYAVNVSQIDPLPHQIEAVYHYILKNPSIRFLLADDPGAGKTIMAGLVLKELKYRGLVDRVLLIVPGHMKAQWIREMKEKFYETFSVIERSTMEASWGRNIWQEQNQVLTSIDFAKQDDVMISLAEVKWDLVIVDEAHKMSAYQYGEKMSRTERYKLGELISRNSNHLLFLTATPHRGDPENFRLFLDLLEPGFFATTEMLAESIRNKDNPLFLRRLKEDMKNFDGKPIFPPRKVNTVKYRLSDDEKRLYNGVTEYVEMHYQKALDKEKRNVAFALIILQRRLASSVRAIRKSLERRKNRLEDILEQGRIIQEQGFINEDILEDYSEIDRWKKEDELLEKLTASETLEELKEEIEKLDELIKLAKEAERKEIETKLSELKKVMDLEDIRRKNEKLLIFTESKDTLEYLVEKIKGWGYTLTYIHGGMNLDKRIEAENEFRNRAQIMVATEAAGEGINLQFCWIMVNYDIPWNPNRLEQRMGRIHRYGQNNEVHIYNLVAVDTREGKILEKLFDKLNKIREQLGSDRVFDVIGDILPGKSLKDLILEAISNKRSLDDILKDFESIPDEDAIKKVKEAALESLATRHIDLSKVLGESRKARENRLVPEYIEQFFLKAANRVSLKLEKRKDNLWRISTVPFDLRNLPFNFKVKFGEVFREYNKFSFVKEEAFKNQAEFVAPGHPLLEAVVEKILEKYIEELEKGAVFIDPSGSLDGFLWFIETEIKDGNGHIAGKRIAALYQDMSGQVRQISPAILWDIKPIINANVSDDKLTAKKSEDEIVAFAIENVLSEYRQELRTQRERDAEIKKKYGLRSIEGLIIRSEEKLLDYETRKAKGEVLPDVIMQNEIKNKEDLLKKKARLEKEIQLEINLLPSLPRILGVAMVSASKAVIGTMVENPEIEAVGMKVAMDYEISQKRAPEDVSMQNLGFDIRSSSPDGKIRYIEVKARSRTGEIAITPNEWLMAARLRDEYWLYVVENAATNPQLYCIQNPKDNLKAIEEVEIVRFVVKEWKNKAEKV